MNLLLNVDKAKARFNLKQGMKNGEILAELRGRTAGEHEQELMLLYHEVSEFSESDSKEKDSTTDTDLYAENGRQVIPIFDHENQPLREQHQRESRPRNNFEVVRQWPGHNYALLRKTLSYYEVGENGKERAYRHAVNYYLAGINDEGSYFLRPLQGIPQDKTGSSLDELLGWLNKEDVGYTKRIQGDIVIQFIRKKDSKEFVNDAFGRTRRVIERIFFPRLVEWNYRLPANGSNREWTDGMYRASNSALRRIEFGEHNITLPKRGLIVTTHHQGLFALEPLVIDAPCFVMKHQEHGRLVIDIPKKHYAVLASQRGREEITAHGTFD